MIMTKKNEVEKTMGFLDKFKKKEEPVTRTPPETLSEVIAQEVERIKAMPLKERAEYKRQHEIRKQEYEKKREIEHKIVDNHINGSALIDEGRIDEAIQCFEENVSLKTEAPYTYDHLAMIYHYKKDFEKERDILNKYLDLDVGGLKADKSRLDFIKRLENVEQFLDTGKWKFDCLPFEPKIQYYNVKEAKTLLKSDEPEKGIQMLEDIMRDGTYNNTVYNSLYQVYKKDKRYDDCIRVCERAIDVLGFFSNDRKDRWNINLEKALKAKEKLK